MAEAVSEIQTFDIIDGFVLDSEQNILQNLTAEECEEVDNVVTLLETAKEDSLEQFEIDQTTAPIVRHKNVTEEELDRLAGKNTAQATSYQTKWANAVMKDKFLSLFSFILHKTWKITTKTKCKQTTNHSVVDTWTTKCQ